MKIKRYVDKDMRRVLRRVREDQGPDAVILSNRRVDDGIEVIAAIDYDEALVRRALGMDPDVKDVINGDALAKLADDDAPPPAAPAPDVVAAELTTERPPDELATSISELPDSLSLEAVREVQEEITSLRGLLETQLSGIVWKDAALRSPQRAQVISNLARIGIAPDVATMVVNRLGPIDEIKSLWHGPLNALARSIPVKQDDLLDAGGVFALIGPTGVGKTTTIAKIAARFAMRHWHDDIALISADAYRIGACEHLTAFANIIGAKVHSASNSNELAEALDRVRGKRLVLIDTEGRSPRDRELADRLAAYGRHQDRVRFYLTLAATAQESGLDESVRMFNRVPLEGCIVTKIDEAAQLGCVLSTLIRHDLPVVWLTDGQRIPEDFHAAERKRLWLVNQAVECMESSNPQIDETTMAEKYAPLSSANV